MRKKLATTMVILLGTMTFTMLQFSDNAMAPPLPDLQLGGDIYICNNGMPLNGTIWEDTTEFAIWVKNDTTTPPFYKWTRYPTTGWYLTDKGRYAAVLPFSDNDVNWTHGGEYRVEINAGPMGYRSTNATSNGTGSGKTTGGGVPFPPDGIPEYSNFGNISNNIAYWVWQDGMGKYQTDDFQLWDVIINCADLVPADVTVSWGTGEQGPYNVPFPSTIGPFVVPANQFVWLNSSVRNQRTSFVNRPTTIAFWNETPAGSGNIGLFFTPYEVVPVPALTTLPTSFTGTWQAPNSPGTFDLFITVDYPWNASLPYAESLTLGNVTELNDTDSGAALLSYLKPPYTNNSVRIRIIVEGPDLSVNMVTVTTDFGQYTFDYLTQGCPQTPIPVNPDVTITIEMNARNVGLDMVGGTYIIAFYNTTSFGGARLSPESFFESASLPALLNNGTSTNVSSTWLAPSMAGSYYINITVDNDTYPGIGDVLEMNDTNLPVNNNTCALQIEVQSVGTPDLVPHIDIFNSIVINGAFYLTLGVPLSNISINITTGQVINISTNPTNIGVVSAIDIDFGYFDNATGSTLPAATPSVYENIFMLLPGERYATNITYLKYYHTEGTYYIFLCIDYNDTIFEDNPYTPIDEEANNNLTIEVNVFDLPPPPAPTLDADDATGDVTISWSNMSNEDVVKYNLYWASSPEDFDFTTAQANVTALGTELSYIHVGGVGASSELYYTVCSVDIRGWEGPCSDIVGKFTMAIPAGYSTFSLPLEPFAHPGTAFSVEWYIWDMGLDELDAIFSYDSSNQKWIPHPRFLPNGTSTFDIEMGESYMIYSRLGVPQYTFEGRPGTTLRYINGTNNPGTNLDDPRIGTDEGFWGSLTAEVDAGDVVLSWNWSDSYNVSAFESLSYFMIFRAEYRGGFGFSTPIGNTTGIELTWTDQNPAGDEYYYIVVPVNVYGRMGSSTLAIGVKKVTYGDAYGDFALFLRPLESLALSDYLELLDLQDMEIVNSLFYFDAGAQTWVPHPAFLPAGLNDPEVSLTDGDMIYLLRSKEYTFVGR